MERSDQGNEVKPSVEAEEEMSEPKRGIRHRKKLLISKLRAQMEFYFSAANLNKDKFMIDLLNRSPYIDLELFFKFNRIRALTDDLNLLKKAIEKSPILELSEDGSKVKRNKEIETKDNEAFCTIYVENIPSHVDHEWVYETFIKYGTIDYISLPHFKSTGRPKGFAFIEFESPQIANAALEAFGSVGCKIPPNTDPSELQSICTYEGTDVEARILNKDMMIKSNDEKEVKDIEDEGLPKGIGSDLKAGDKRKIEEIGISIDGESEKQPQKKTKVSDPVICEIDKKVENETYSKVSKGMENEEPLNSCTTSVENIIKKVRRDMERDQELKGKEDTDPLPSLRKRANDENDDDENKISKKKRVIGDADKSVKDQVASTEETPVLKAKGGKKKRRKRSKKDKGVSLESASLKVMSKQEWTRLRNEYLNMQRRNMESLKWDLKKRRYIPAIDYSEHQQVPLSKRQPQFVPNAVIKISFEEPPQDPRKLQETIREWSGGGVAYVEISAAEKDVYIRFVSGDAAAAYLKAGLWSRMILLSGEEEKEYWKRCVDCWLKGRNKKKQDPLSSNDPACKIRGREKLFQKALREAQFHKPTTHKVFEG